MRAPISVRIFRTLLAVSVSLWMAGTGCMLGCSNTVIAAPQSQKSQTVVAGASCDRPSHDCCAKRNSSAAVNADAKTSLWSAAPKEMMGECPLAVNANAITASKATHHTPEYAQTSPAELSGVESINRQSNWAPPPVQFLNRGRPTYLRCCVFLI